MSEIPDRALTFRVHFSMRNGVIRSQGIDVGHITGTVIIPLRATFRSFPPPGSYNVELPGSGLPELIVETMGSVDAAALLATFNPPPPAHWNVIPEECLERLELEAQLDFQSVQADEEWKANEPADIEAAGTHFDGTWKLTIPFPLGCSVRKDVTGAGTKVGVQRLKNHRVLLSISLPTSPDGTAGRKCPSCRRFFKVDREVFALRSRQSKYRFGLRGARQPPGPLVACYPSPRLPQSAPDRSRALQRRLGVCRQPASRPGHPRP